MSKNWKWSQVHSTTHFSLWSDLGTIMMDIVADLSSSSAELDFINATSNPVVIKPGQIVATAIQINSVEVMPKFFNIEPDDDKSIPSAESVFTCVEQTDTFLYPCIISDESINRKEEEFDLDMEIVAAPISRPKATRREKGTMIC